MSASWQLLTAQCVPPGTGSGETCQDPIDLCTGNIPVSTSGFSPDPPLVFCGGGATTENNSWVQFIAGAPMVSFEFVLTTCQNGNGVQAVIFQAINGDCNNLVELACFNSGGTAQDFTVSANVTPGEVYLLMIDGYAGDQCDFNVTPTGVETNPAPPPVPVIDAPDIVCGPAASNVTLTVTNPQAGTDYVWYEPSWVNQTGTSITVDLSGYVGQTIQFCVEAAVPCVPECACTEITVDNEPLVLINPPPPITCDNPTTTIDASGSSSGPGFTFTWTAMPGNIVSGGNTLTPTVDQAGTYTLTILSDGGCETTESVVVEEFTTPPIVTIQAETITCSTPAANVLATSTPPNLNYTWSGPNGFTGVGPGINVTEPGVYTVTVVDNYGCETIESVTVEEDTTPPDASATGGFIDCYNPTVMIMGNSNTPGVTFEWQGPFGFMSNQQNPIVDAIGPYILTVTAPNGCTTQVVADVDGDLEPPDLLAEGGEITCTEEEIVLDATSNTPGATFQWTGPGGFTSNLEDPTVDQLGTYFVTVTDPVNGCTSETSVFVNDIRVFPVLFANPQTITCDDETVTLDVTSTPSTVTYEWTGPFGFMSTEQNPEVDQPGTYTVTVTTLEGCSSTIDVPVGIDVTPPLVTATGGQLSCQLGSITLFANSNTGITYEWTGPNGFESNEIAPSVSTPGIYTVVVTAANGCTAEATAEVTQDDDVPEAIINGENITCLDPEANLEASSNQPGVFFSWTGPNNFTSGAPFLVVTDPGIYILTVTAPNGCEGTAEFNVQDESITPDIALVADTISCTNNSLDIEFTSSIDDLTYAWSGPNGFTSTDEDPEIDFGGTYSVTVTSTGGCENSSSIDVPVDTLPPSLDLVVDTISCQVDTVQIQSTTNKPITSYFWTGPSGYNSLESDPVVNTPGVYVLTLEATNGCITIDSIEVFADTDLPDVTAEGDTLACNVNEVQITGSSSVPGVTYEWTGPNGFTSNQQNPLVSDVGSYTLTVLAPNGCRASTTTEVVIDDATPDALAQGGTLTCTDDTISIQGSSTVQNVTFSWTGPGGFSSNDQNPDVFTGGEYILTVTADNGCTNTDTIQVAEDFTPPDVSAAGDTITCQQGDVVLQGGSATPGATFAWNGPGGFTSTDQNPTVSTAGTYTLEVTGPNGCTATADADVALDAGVPIVTADGADLDCNNPETTLTGTSSIPGVTYSWTGPNGFTSNDQNPLIDEGGAYTLMVMAPNGCSSQATVFIDADFSTPDISGEGDTITCNDPNGTITGNSLTSGAVFSWTGPGGFTATGPTTVVMLPGTYTLEVTGPNGCTSTLDIEVESDENVPPVTAEGGLINCIDTEVELQADVPPNIVSLNWNGPNGFTSTEQNPIVDQPGEYTIVIEADNGCVNSDQAQVLENTQQPNLQTTGGELNCVTEEVQIQALTSTPGVTIAWTGPNGFNSSIADPIVSEAGNYMVMLTDPANGCTNSEIALVTEDTLQPTALDLTVITPSCISDVGAIFVNNVVGGHAPFEFSVDGGNTFLDDPNLEDLAPGDYSILVRDNIGCEYEEQINIPDISEVEITLDPEIFIELGDSAQINVEVNIPEDQIANIIWTPTDFLSCTDCLDPIANPDRAVKYKVTVIDVNGCADSELVIVIPEFDPAIYIPNVFSPTNNDNINDLFYPFGNEEKIVQINRFEVYDRWGELVHAGYDFQPNDPTFGWDGTLKGEPMNPAVFVYQVEVEYKNGEIRLYKGDVTLVD